MKRYLVMGSCMEYMAHLCVDASDESDALEQWKKSFPNCAMNTYMPKVYDGTREELGRYESGGYQYLY
jgi:hypothetical protein